jgi:hypothetical protein
MLNQVGFIWEAQRGGPRRLKKARISVPNRPTPKPVNRNRNIRAGATAASMPRIHVPPRGPASSDAVIARMKEASGSLASPKNESAASASGNHSNSNQDATLQMLINQQQALLESQRRNAALLTAMQPQFGMQGGMQLQGGMNMAAMPANHQFMPGSAFLMPQQQFAAMPVLYTANGMPFQLQPFGANPFGGPAMMQAQPNMFPNMGMAGAMMDPNQQQQFVALQQQQSMGIHAQQQNVALLQSAQAAMQQQPTYTILSPTAASSVPQQQQQQPSPTKSLAPPASRTQQQEYEEDEGDYDEDEEDDE